jgi:hypothetical protein
MDMPAVCLVGSKLTSDWPLVRRLLGKQVVTLIRSCAIERLARERLLETVEVLVIDGRDWADEPQRLVDAIGAIHSRRTRLAIMLVDGLIDQDMLVEAYRRGIRDFFRCPYPRELLSERLGALCRRPPGPED